MLNMSVKAITKNNPFEAVFNDFVSRNKGLDVNIQVIQNVATTIVNANVNILDHSGLSFLEKKLQEKYENVTLVQGAITSHILVFNERTFEAFSGDGGLFTSGLHVTIPHDGNPTGTINRVLRRLLGGYTSIIKHRKVSWKVDFTTYSSNDLLREIDFGMGIHNNSHEQYLINRLLVLSVTKASLHELLSASNKIRSITRDWDAAAPLKVDEILDAYSLVSPNEVSTNWCKSASTPIKLIDVFNLLTEVGARVDRGHEKIQLAQLAGKVLTKTGDLEDCAPAIKWGEFDRTAVNRLNK